MKKQCKRLIGTCFLMLMMMFTMPMKTEASEVTGNMDWKWPVPSSNTLSSCYLDGRAHYAIDISAAKGASIYACYEGVVIDTYHSCSHNYAKSSSCGCNGGLGNSVYVRHNYNGVDYVSRYGHLTAIEVSVGDVVTTDTIIGTVGSTGSSGNHHLDLRIYQGSSKSHTKTRDCVDPLKDLLLEIPEGINANKASTGCCYSYMKEVKQIYADYQAQKEAEELARQQVFEEALRDWVEAEVFERDNYYCVKSVELELQQFLQNYN